MAATFPVNHEASSSVSLSPIVMNPATKYARVVDEPGCAIVSAKDAALDTSELITYRYSDVKKVSTTMENQNPPKIKSGVQYVIKVETLLRVDDTTSPSGKTDLPVVGYLTLRHPRHAAITNTELGKLTQMVLGASYDFTKGEFRFEDLARGAVTPTED